MRLRLKLRLPRPGPQDSSGGTKIDGIEGIGSPFRASGVSTPEFRVVAIGSLPIVCAGIANLLRIELGHPVRILATDWADAVDRLAALRLGPNLVAAHVDGIGTPQTWARLAEVVHGAPIVAVIPVPSPEARAELAHARVQAITLGAPLGEWRRVILAAIGQGKAARSQRPAGMRGLSAPLDRLTQRQREVFDFVAAGLSNKAIASRLELSVGTVKLHVAAVLHALHARNRLDLVLRNPAVLARTARRDSGNAPGRLAAHGIRALGADGNDGSE